MANQQQHSKSGTSAQLAIVVGLLFAIFVLIDVITPSLFSNAWSGIFMMNIVIGQLTLICVWGTLVEGTFWVRLPWTILLLVVSWGALCFGVHFEEGKITSAQVLGMGLVWGYGFVISFIPLKLAAWLFSWRLTLESQQGIDEEASRYTIRDIMVGTAILAVTLAIGRLFVPGDWPEFATVLRQSGLDDTKVVVALFIFSIISLAVKLPCIWIALAISREKILRYSVAWIVCSGLLGLVELGILIAFFNQPRGKEFAEFIFGLVFGHSAMAVIMIGALYSLRWFGYRLSRKPKQTIAEA